MKPLVYYCRWQNVSLRLRGRSETAVWGELVSKHDTATVQAFHFDLQNRLLTLKEDEEDRTIKLDEMGTVIG